MFEKLYVLVLSFVVERYIMLYIRMLRAYRELGHVVTKFTQLRSPSCK